MINKIKEFFRSHTTLAKRLLETETKLIKQGYMVNIKQDKLIEIFWATNKMIGSHGFYVTKYDILNDKSYNELLRKLY